MKGIADTYKTTAIKEISSWLQTNYLATIVLPNQNRGDDICLALKVNNYTLHILANMNVMNLFTHHTHIQRSFIFTLEYV